MKRVALVSIVDVSLGNGQGVYARKTIEAFCAASEYSFQIILPRPTDPQIEEVITNLAPVIFLPSKTRSRNVAWHIYVQCRLLLALMRLGRMDAIIYSVKPMMFAPLLYARLYRCPVFLLVEGLSINTLRTLTHGFSAWIGERVLEASIKAAREVFPAYQSAKQWVDRLRGGDSVLLPCGVDPDKFRPRPKTSTLRLTIGYVGSFRKVHMLKELVLAAVDADAAIMLVGEGEQSEELKRLVAESGLQAKVSFMGALKQEDLPEFFAKCDVMWATCDERHWGIPIKCFEYLACNKKVIYTEKPDLEFIREFDFGYMLRRTDVASIRRVLNHVEDDYRNGHLVDNDASRDYVLAHNDWGAFREQILPRIRSSAEPQPGEQRA